MSQAQETQVNIFKAWLDSFPVEEYDLLRNRVIKDCRITSQVFRHWKCGASKIPELAQEKINEIAGYQVFELE